MKSKIYCFMNKEVDAKKVFCLAMVMVVVVTVIVNPQYVAFATGTTDPASAASVVTAKFQMLIDLVAGIVSSIGMLVCMWGISEWGISLQSSEGGMQASAFKKIGGGIVTALAPQLAPLLLL